jgi:hypothetical protein
MRAGARQGRQGAPQQARACARPAAGAPAKTPPRAHHHQELGLRCQDAALLGGEVLAAQEHHLHGHLSGGLTTSHSISISWLPATPATAVGVPSAAFVQACNQPHLFACVEALRQVDF